MLNLKAFEKVKNQIGSCSLWCGSCVVGNGTLRELTKKYVEIVKGYGLEGWAPKDFDFKGFMKGLETIQAIPLCSGCKKGGGKEECAIRMCASRKNFNDCSECDQVTTCKNSEEIEHMRTGGSAAGLMVKTENVDSKELIEKWTAELKNKWPCCIQFSCGQ